MLNVMKDENRSILMIEWADQLLHAIRIAIVLTSRYWATAILGPIK